MIGIPYEQIHTRKYARIQTQIRPHIKNRISMYIYISHYQEQVGISISSIELLYHTWVFDLGHQLNLILLLLLYIYS